MLVDDTTLMLLLIQLLRSRTPGLVSPSTFMSYVCVFLHKFHNFQGKWGSLEVLVYFDSYTDLCNDFTAGLDGERELYSADVI